MKRTNTFVTAIRVTLFTVILLLVSQQVKCQLSNNKASSLHQIDFSTMIERVKSYAPEKFTFSVSAPSLVAPSADGWEIAYYAFADDSLVRNFCSQADAIEYLPQLVDLLDDEQCSWQVNIMLYNITMTNAIELMAYSPNRVEAWVRERKDKDLACWKKFIQNKFKQKIAVMGDSLSSTLRQHCSLWLNSWERELKADSFTLVRSYTSSLSTGWEEFDISEKYFSDYRDKISYSPTGSYALDLYSYNLILSKKGAKTYAELDADIQIYVIDVARHQRLPIFFLGPTASIDDGYWLSNSTVVLAGWERCFDCPEEAYRPNMYKVNVFTGETVKYDYSTTFSQYNKDYLKQKFPKVIFDF